MAYDRNEFQLTHLLQAVYDRLEQSRALYATGGSTTTIVDTGISTDIQDDDFKGMYAFVQSDAGGAGAAPEGEYKKCTAYAAQAFTLTFTEAFSAAIGAGDRISLIRNSLYPVNDVIRIANTALRELGRIPVRYTSLTTASGQTEYTLPLGAKGEDLIEVEYQDRTGDSNNNNWLPVYWRIMPDTAGTAEVMRVPQLPEGRTLAITYQGTHPVLSNFYDPIQSAIPRELAISLVAYRVASWKRDASRDKLAILERDFNAAQAIHPVKKYAGRVQGFPQWRSARVQVNRDENGVEPYYGR